MSSILFVDTWGWITLANKNEAEHQAVKQLYRDHVQRNGKIITTDYVLDELITFLFVRCPASIGILYLKSLFASIVAGFIRVENIHRTRFEEAWSLRLKYADKPAISFTDFTSFVVMRECRISRVLTNDHHFRQAQLGFQPVP